VPLPVLSYILSVCSRVSVSSTIIFSSPLKPGLWFGGFLAVLVVSDVFRYTERNREVDLGVLVCVCARLLGADGFIYRVSKREPFSIMYVYYIHPELGIGNYRFGSRKGAGSL